MHEIEFLHAHYSFDQVAANGMAYVKRNVREGLLGRMLTELLDTRIMVKQVGGPIAFLNYLPMFTLQRR